MRSSLIAIALILSVFLFSQSSPVKLKGEIQELSIGPDSSIWLCSNAGIIYWTKDLKKDLIVKLAIEEPKQDFLGQKRIYMYRISFFNKDTLFLSGSLGRDLIGKEKGNANKIFLSKDGGNNWELIMYNRTGSSVYESFTTENGKAWLCGSSGEIFHSDDFGESWKVLSIPFKSSKSTTCIDMYNQMCIVGSIGNDLKISEDDLLTFKKVKTPFDKKKYKKENKSGSYGSRLNKVLIANNYFIANQQDNVFYSDIGKIDWQKFDPELSKFEYNVDNNVIVGLTNENELVVFSPDFSLLKTLDEIPTEETVIDIKVRNNIVYLLTATYGEPTESEFSFFGGTSFTINVEKVESYKIYTINNDEILTRQFEVEN